MHIEENLHQVWNNYYTEVDNDTALKDKNFFRMEIEAIIDAVHKACDRFSNRTPIRILELGSGTGFLAKAICSELDSKSLNYKYFGVDFSEVATAKASARNLQKATFFASDFFDFFEKNSKPYHLIIAQRSIMAITESSAQNNLLEEISGHLESKGIGIFSECTDSSLKTLQDLRGQLGLPEDFQKVWHSLYVDVDVIQKIFSKVSIRDFSSTYWLITRVVYPYFQDPVHNSKIHDFAASLEQSGNYGLVKLFVAEK